MLQNQADWSRCQSVCLTFPLSPRLHNDPCVHSWPPFAFCIPTLTTLFTSLFMAMHLSATTWTVYGFANFFGMSREHVRWMNFLPRKTKALKKLLICLMPYYKSFIVPNRNQLERWMTKQEKDNVGFLNCFFFASDVSDLSFYLFWSLSFPFLTVLENSLGKPLSPGCVGALLH